MSVNNSKAASVFSEAACHANPETGRSFTGSK